MMLHLPLFVILARPMQHLESISAKFIMNEDPKMTLTYIMAKSNVVICVLEWGLLNILNK